LRPHHEVVTAESGEEGLRLIAETGPFQVVVSDMRMPTMDGATFLAQVKKVEPKCIRILLTGQSDLELAMRAVNEGSVFRFLTKPCPFEQLKASLDEAVEQHRAASADRIALERTQAQLLQADRLATLGLLAGGVGHELNNITAVFLSTLSVVQERAAEGKPPTAEELSDLARVGDHLKTHAAHLLNLGRPVEVGGGESDLNEVVKATVSMMRTTGRMKHIDLTMTLAPESVYVPMTRTRTEQILVNLLTNAADAIREVRDRPWTMKVAVVLDSSTGRVRCEIEDSGTGIEQDKLDQIFEPYYTTKPVGRGTGLGLPVVKSILEGHGGSLRVQSQVGVGSTFIFELPLAS
jgi:signal transduction histidine kinase